MRRSTVLHVAGVAAGLVFALAGEGATVAYAKTTRAVPAPTTGASVLTATNTGPSYAPTFTGNGLLGVRVPPSGQGYAPGTVPAQSELAGFYAEPPGGVQQRANTPTWSTLTFNDGGTPFSLSAGTTSGWKQALDLRTGVITTSARWTAPDGHVSNIVYQVFTDRARANVGVVQLTVTPQWTGTATVIDTIDGTPATLSTQVSKGWAVGANRDFLGIQAQGTTLGAGLSSQVATSSNVSAVVSQADQTTDQTVSQRLDFPVTAGASYTITKYVGVESSLQTGNPVSGAQAAASTAATLGFNRLLAENNTAWSQLWSGRIDVTGNTTLATEVNASEFYLWSNVRQGVNLSVSPAGLSSNGYDGHIFWDAETWMFPSLLAQHSALSSGINQYRSDRLLAAEQHASATGYKGARFPWESALDGTEQIPPPASVNSEGLYGQHITADIALAQWQYYLATNNRSWLATRGWPVLSQAATFWASRVTLGADGRYHITGVTGPDEENPNVNDEAYTNVAARTTLQDAVAAGRVLGQPVPGAWSRIASKLVVATNSARSLHPEFAGYGGQLVKQADVTLMQYPWAFPMTKRIAQNDLNYYVPRTDPTGPSMSDAVNSIDSSALGSAGCANYVYTRRSIDPFIRDVFDQFSETKTGGAFTFMTGIGGFLQEFLYGYSGLRWLPTSVQLDPSLTGQLGSIVLHNLSWRGRVFTVSIGRTTTTVTVTSGRNLVLATPVGKRLLSKGHSLVLPTRRADLTSTTDVVQCARATATSSLPGALPLAAVDGSPATDWQPASLPATLTLPIAAGQFIRTATVRWGDQWPPAPGPNIPPPPGPVQTLRASTYAVQISQNGTSWRTIAAVNGRTTGTVDVSHFLPVSARFIRLQITAATGTQPPMLDEISVTG